MRVLYIGDIMAEPGRRTVTRLLPDVKAKFQPDFIIAQAENISDEGKGPGPDEIAEMQKLGIDFFTGGNHSLTGKKSKDLYNDVSAPVTRPANLPDTTGYGYKIINTKFGNILVASILGQTVGRPVEIENPLKTIDRILDETKHEKLVARIVNFHGDFSSEKRVIGYYLDGRVSAVIGDHWHVPTADALVLPKGTAHITDVGMCGTLHSSLGVKIDVIEKRWLTGKSSKNEMEIEGPMQFNALLVDIDTSNGSATSVMPIHWTVDQ